MVQNLAAFEYEIVHRTEKIIGQADTRTTIPNQDATMDQAHSTTRGAEAKHPMQNSDESNEIEWPNRPRTGEGKEPVTYQKKQSRPNLQQQHLYSKSDEQERNRQSSDLAQTVCQTKNSKKFDLVEVSRTLFESTASITHSILLDFKLAASIAKQVREEFPNT